MGHLSSYKIKESRKDSQGPLSRYWWQLWVTSQLCQKRRSYWQSPGNKHNGVLSFARKWMDLGREGPYVNIRQAQKR
jgi:hypothetical protein